jgi:hypothetical protein
MGDYKIEHEMLVRVTTTLVVHEGEEQGDVIATAKVEVLDALKALEGREFKVQKHSEETTEVYE